MDRTHRRLAPLDDHCRRGSRIGSRPANSPIIHTQVTWHGIIHEVVRLISPIWVFQWVRPPTVISWLEVCRQTARKIGATLWYQASAQLEARARQSAMPRWADLPGRAAAPDLPLAVSGSFTPGTRMALYGPHRHPRQIISWERKVPPLGYRKRRPLEPDDPTKIGARFGQRWL